VHKRADKRRARGSWPHATSIVFAAAAASNFILLNQQPATEPQQFGVVRALLAHEHSGKGLCVLRGTWLAFLPAPSNLACKSSNLATSSKTDRVAWMHLRSDEGEFPRPLAPVIFGRIASG
jgi:hypothetical protein